MIADDPRLTVRAEDIDMQGRRVLRVICDSRLRTAPTAKIFREPGAVLILTTSKDELRRRRLMDAGAEVARIGSDGSGGVDLPAALKYLADRECNEVLVEAGPQLSGRFIDLGLANELLIYMAPVVLGADARSMFATAKLESLSGERNRFQVQDIARIGEDVRVRVRQQVKSQ